jgi:2-polyprenyl-3-methyl-5-hydroxy-6-metoxy-1,4-benzoquinol methylase
MTLPAIACPTGLEARARQSLGSSSDAIYRMVARALDARGINGGTLVDVGCGQGGLWRAVGGGGRFSRYCGLDAVRYDGFPAGGEFCRVDLDAGDWPIADASADVVTAVETIEHLENPWAFMRRLSALARPGAWVIVTTPNQLSALSLLTLFTRRRFVAFQDVHFPTHRTSLLESDLCRAAFECGLETLDVAYSLHGRLPLTPWHYPAAIARALPRLLSDNLMLVARNAPDHGLPRP